MCVRGICCYFNWVGALGAFVCVWIFVKVRLCKCERESLLGTMLASVVRGDGGDRATVTPNVYYIHTDKPQAQLVYVCECKCARRIKTLFGKPRCRTANCADLIGFQLENSSFGKRVSVVASPAL